jgi:hypothetical protein
VGGWLFELQLCAVRGSAAGDGEQMKIWFDTEFIEDGKTIDLMSIGMVREDGAELYLESADCDLMRANPWVTEHVVSKLGPPQSALSRSHIARLVVEFAGDSPEFWAYYADYDWVSICQLYGTMMDLPKGWPMFCRDLKQLQVDRSPGLRFPRQDPASEHHALNDARWVRDTHVWLMNQLRVSDENR